jgi:hypothetical protein
VFENEVASRSGCTASEQKGGGVPDFTESMIEEATLQWFEAIGYASLHGPDIAPGEPAAERARFGDVVLAKRLRDAIRSLNPTIPDEAHEDAQRRVLRIASPSLIQTNRAFHHMLRDEVEVEYRLQSGRRGDQSRGLVRGGARGARQSVRRPHAGRDVGTNRARGGVPARAGVCGPGFFRGHDYSGPVDVHVDRQRRDTITRRLWRWLKRRAAIEPGIGHLKQEHRMDRNRLKGQAGDMLNAIFSAAGMNFRKLRAHAAAICALLRALLRLALHRLGQLHRPPTHAITPLFMPVA